MRCSAKLTRARGQQPRVVCESRFCQGLEAQCQLCKTIYSLSADACPNCSFSGPVKKQNVDTLACVVCSSPCFRSDIIAPLLPSGKACGHGMCQSCVVETVNYSIAQKTLVSLFKCSYPSCPGLYEVSQFQAALEAQQDPAKKAKIDELYNIQSMHAFISKHNPGEILL